MEDFQGPTGNHRAHGLHSAACALALPHGLAREVAVATKDERAALAGRLFAFQAPTLGAEEMAPLLGARE